MNPATLRTIPLLIVVLLCHCGAPQPPQCVRVPLASRQPAATLVASACEQWLILGNRSRAAEWSGARTRYNAAVAKLFDQLRCGPGDWDSRAAALATSIAPPDAKLANLKNLDALFPASQVNTRTVACHQLTESRRNIKSIHGLQKASFA